MLIPINRYKCFYILKIIIDNFTNVNNYLNVEAEENLVFKYIIDYEKVRLIEK